MWCCRSFIGRSASQKQKTHSLLRSILSPSWAQGPSPGGSWLGSWSRTAQTWACSWPRTSGASRCAPSTRPPRLAACSSPCTPNRGRCARWATEAEIERSSREESLMEPTGIFKFCLISQLLQDLNDKSGRGLYTEQWEKLQPGV